MRFAILLLSVLSAAPSFALPKRAAPAPAAPAATSELAVSMPEPAPAQERFLLDFALASIDENFHTGVYGRYENALDPGGIPLLGGARIGFLYGPNTPKTWVIPIQGELTWQFEESKGMAPYLGIAAGLAVVHANSSEVEIPSYTIGGTTVGGGTTGTESFTRARFAGLVRLGLQIGPKFHAEIPFGSISNAFTFGLSAGTTL
jgi:hypothetical protein